MSEKEHEADSKPKETQVEFLASLAVTLVMVLFIMDISSPVLWQRRSSPRSALLKHRLNSSNNEAGFPILSHRDDGSWLFLCLE